MLTRIFVFPRHTFASSDSSGWLCKDRCSGLDQEKWIERFDLLGWICLDGYTRMALKGLICLGAFSWANFGKDLLELTF